MKIQAAIFDMDGTVVDSLHFWDSFFKQFGERFFGDSGFRLTDSDDRRIRTMVFDDAMAYIAEAYHIDEPIESVVRFGNESVERFYRHSVREKNGARAFLQALREKGIRVALATATDMCYVPIALEACGLSGLFDVMLSCADLGVGKNRPDIYQKALAELGVAAGDACVFEDSFVALETAKALGCLTVGVYDSHSFEHERLRKASTVYLGEGQDFFDLLPTLEL